MDFQVKLSIIQFLLPPVCSGVLLLGFVVFLYLFLYLRERLHLSLAVLGLIGFVFVFSESLLLSWGGWKHVPEIAETFHRIEQIAGIFFIFGLPFLMATYLELTPSWKKLNVGIAWAGLAVAIVLCAASLVLPEHFISSVTHNMRWSIEEGSFGRGQQGILYTIRDCLLAVLMIYSLVLLVAEIRLHRRLRGVLPVLIGLAFGVLGALVDIWDVYTGLRLDRINLSFSRFSLGLTVFIFLSMVAVLNGFINQSRNLKFAIRSLEKSEKRFNQISDNIAEVFWLFDMDGGLLYINSSFEKVWGIGLQRLYEDPQVWTRALHPDDLRYVKDSYRRENLVHGNRLEYRLKTADDRVKWIQDSIYLVKDESGRIYRVARISEDITERKRAEDELTFLAYFDSLTNLPNRRSFFERFEDTLIQARKSRNEQARALVMLDLDNFKMINDSFGHEVGDLLLVEIAERVRKAIRRQDYLFRLGSDEFVVILTMLTGEADTADVVQKIREGILNPFAIRDFRIMVSASYGISLFPRDGTTREELVKHADIALSSAKREKNVLRFFTPAMQAEADHRMEIANKLRQAVENRDFILHYQPVVDCRGRVVAAEALVRWIDRQTGHFIMPAEFISIAEETGLIIPLGDWVLRSACLQQKVWSGQGIDLRIAVNLSPRQFRQTNLAEKVLAIIGETGLSPGNLDIEITEGCVMEDPEPNIGKMRQLVDHGVVFSIDDFGTGYSSLSYLQRFPVKNLKIDRSFVNSMEKERSAELLIRTMVSLAHSLEMNAIAEGVETVRQAEILAGIGCDCMQGYYFAKPLPPEGLVEMIRSAGTHSRDQFMLT